MLAIRAVPTFALAMVALMLATWAHPGARAQSMTAADMRALLEAFPNAHASLLHETVRTNFDPAALAVLIEAGADVNARDANGITPLHLAVMNNPNPAVIAALLEAGADVGETRRGATPLHFAAALNPNPAVIAALLKGGADINARRGDGGTPLHSAARTNPNPAVIAALLEAGADAGARTKDGKTAFDYAKDNTALQGTEVYWRLNEARFE